MSDFTTLSVDLGSTIGYALAVNGAIVDSGEVGLSAKDTHPGHRWLKFQSWLQQHREVNEILFEEIPRFESAAAAKVYCGLLAVLQIFALAHGIRMAGLGPSAVKKDFTGSGNCKKDVICDVAMRLGWKNGVPGTINRNNEADAIALFWVVSTRRGVEPKFL